MNTRTILLASKSPRRQYLLEQSDLNFEVRIRETDESYPDDLEVEDIAKYIAINKAIAAAEFISHNEIVLAADTTVIFNGRLYEKPTNRDDAVRMLSDMQGKKHLVVTGVCLLSSEKEVSFAETTEVFLEAMTKEEIDHYVDKYQPYDKAGAYGIQEWIGWTKIGWINGSYSNVMGLPLSRVYKEIQDWAHSPEG